MIHRLDRTSSQFLVFYIHDLQLRVVWYICMVLASDEETEKRGVVIVMLNDGDAGDRKSALKMPVVFGTMPVRFEAAHLCNDSPGSSKVVDSLLKFMAGKVFRVRMRSHFGMLFN